MRIVDLSMTVEECRTTTDPRWWDESPCLTRAAAEWLVERRPSVLGFDFAQEEKGADYARAESAPARVVALLDE